MKVKDCIGCLTYEQKEYKEKAACIWFNKDLGGGPMFNLPYKDPINNIKCIGYIVKDTGCPCMTCLIKMMCRVTCTKMEDRKWPAEYRRV